MDGNASSAELTIKAKEKLESYVKDYKIFIDTCSLLRPEIETFWGNIVPYLHRYSKKVIITTKVLEELKKHSGNMSDANLASAAKKQLDNLHSLYSAGFVEFRGENTDNFADNVFIVVFTKFRMQHNLLLITQDNNLAGDIMQLNGSRSVKSSRVVEAKRINKYGFLSNVGSSPAKSNTKLPQDATADAEKFRICTQVTSRRDDPVLTGRIPEENDTVRTSRQGSIRLIQRLAAGGEGVIYQTDTPYVAKIYKREKITYRKLEKLKLLQSKNLHCEGICFPVDLLYNSAGEFVGYLMPVAKGKELQKSIFIKPLFQKSFPTWKKRDTVELCITILNKIRYLHNRNIIMGDINPANILVVSTKEVYFVDTDSYQIEDYPCPVGTINYTAPEIQGKPFPDFLRSMGNENFALATLLFMIMLPGKPPYSQQGGEDPISNIIRMDFSYPFGERSNKKTPDGPWRYIWSHLTYELKEAFYHTFRKDGKYSQENTRLSVDDWLRIFTKYLDLLDSGKLGEQDKMSEVLYPTRHKKNPNVKYVKCKLCGTEVPEDSVREGYCRECLNAGTSYKCKECGKELIYTNFQKYIKKARQYELCPECFQRRNQVREYRTCADCGATFPITQSDFDFYTARGYDLPKRCKSCREQRKNGDSSYSRASTGSYSGSYPGAGSSSSGSASSSSSSGSGGRMCFITTAVCEYYGKPDDCYELTTFRKYRDEWLRQQPDGEELVSEYYRIAPDIVSGMKASPEYPNYCERIWKQFLSPCLAYIQSGAYEDCKNLYKQMVRELQQEFSN